MQRFRDQDSRVLITTNVLARGVDVPSVAAVINFDLPYDFEAMKRNRGGAVPDYETFVHRIGRTGRADKSGTAITFFETPAELNCIREIDYFFSSVNQQARKAAQQQGNAAAVAANAANAQFESMFTFWDGNDITGLVQEIERRQEEFELRGTA